MSQLHFLSRVIDLKENIETLTTQHKAAIQELTSELKDMKTAFDEHNRASQKETSLKEAVELALAESQNIIDDLKTKVTELENSRPNPGKITFCTRALFRQEFIIAR